MAIAATILKAVAKEGLKAIVTRQLFDKYFPKDFEEQMRDALARVDAKIDSIGQDAAFTRVHPVRRAFLLSATYVQDTFYHTMEQQAKAKALDPAVAAKLADRLMKEIEKLDGNMVDAKEIFDQRAESCDFPVRFLFETMRDMAALRLAMISWVHGLYRDLPGGASSAAVLAEKYVRARADAESFAPKATARLIAAREAFISFEKKIDYKSGMDVDQFGNRKLDHVVCKYQDKFSSSYRSDPFAGDRIDHAVDVEWHWYDFAYRQSKELALANAYEDAQRWDREHRDHVAGVGHLNKKHLTDPTDAYLAEVRKTVPTLEE
ncbi:MAG: hypothetical protein KYX69_16780 [Sphingomonas sp.]|uniref:hypothetical protein n=1 Tax=Sphingomonas sp. TaxID=28214 RepID=UPI0026278953|nr:hypothetical protein [Sphingomonas sp.]MDK2769361.1 hypothetical protein [Sphingomonas sp.]